VAYIFVQGPEKDDDRRAVQLERCNINPSNSITTNTFINAPSPHPRPDLKARP
jgi:hypothetical protein